MTEFGWQEAFLATAAWVFLGGFTWNISRMIMGRNRDPVSNSEALAFVNLLVIWPVAVLVIAFTAIGALIAFLTDIAIGDHRAP